MLAGVRDPDLAAAVDSAAARWDAESGTPRLFARDASLWTGGDEARWLGWLDPAEAGAGLDDWMRLADGLRGEVADVLVLGMGGSSLWPLVIARTFARTEGRPALRILDSTDPAEVLAAERAVDLARTLVVVASKSGSTLEPALFLDRLFASVSDVTGPVEAGSRFVAITDPGSGLERTARQRGFRAIVPGMPSIGGRFSALSAFGMLPAALCGAPVAGILASARTMASRCRDLPARENPGVLLGCALAALARRRRDKVTIVASPGIGALGAWIEQLVAESTGKRGMGLVPVDGETLGPPEAYGSDRVFVAMILASDADVARDRRLEALATAGHPVLRIDVREATDLGGLAYQWEIATAVAGAILGLHPFDQPDVEAAKIASRALMEEWERSGRLPEDPAASGQSPLSDRLRAHLGRIVPDDYLAVLAFTPETERIVAALQLLRHAVRDARRVATCLGFGPRFLHSTGQLHKGGPATGVFLQITCDDAEPCSVPGRPYGFSIVKAAQAAGDRQVLEERGRRILHVHVTGDVATGVERLAADVVGLLEGERP